MQTGDGRNVVNFPDGSIELGNAFTGNDLFWSGLNGTGVFGGINPRLFAPEEFQAGSSLAHWDESDFPAGDPNSLMTPRIGRGEAILDPGDITVGLLNDIGFNMVDRGETYVLTATGDAKVNSADSQSDSNFGAQDDMFARYKPTGWAYDSYVKFDLPKVEEAENATLRLHGFVPEKDQKVNVVVFGTDNSWEELDITFNNAPGPQTDKLDNEEVTNERKYYEFHVTDFVNEQIQAGATSIAFVLKSTTKSRVYPRAKFLTKEAGSNPPQLVIEAEDAALPVCIPTTIPVEEDAKISNAPSQLDDNLVISRDCVQEIVLSGDMNHI